MSSNNNNIQSTFSLSSPCQIDEASVSSGVFRSIAYKKYFATVNNKFLGTYDDEHSAKQRALSYAQDHCLQIKHAFLK